ncbi:MAG: cysteine--tRNA ligase [Patescibacteria group bacterium]
MLTIYNTLTRKKEKFIPLHDKRVTFYHCGPTVYWTQHLGNMRANMAADVVVRTLEYLGYTVKLVRNYTDVGHLTSDQDEGEDKLDKGARRDHTTPQAVADKYIDTFNHDLDLLNVRLPDIRPRASEQIKEIQAMVADLLTKGFAYETDLAVYFDVTKAKEYNRLSRQKMDSNISEAGKGTVHDPSKRHPADFALWFFKAGTHKNALQTWPSPFHSILVQDGEGFPGWHIECSVMSQKYLGDTIDLHLGGVEHIPVHHTNEIAQSEAATGKPFVKYWLHNEHLIVNGGKMAKSAGTSYTLHDVIDKGFDPLAFRYLCLGAQYRSKINFTWEALKASQNAYENLLAITASLGEPKIGCAEFEQRFSDALSDDFNSPKGLAIVWDLLKSDYPSSAKKASLLKFDEILGLKLAEVRPIIIPDEINKLAEQREIARRNKDWTGADKIRAVCAQMGYDIEDTPSGPIVKRRKKSK